MQVFLNDRCFNDRSDINEIIKALHDSISSLSKRGIKIISTQTALRGWYEEWKDYLDNTAKRYYPIIASKIETVNNVSEQFYYHYIRHQDLTPGISDNISTSALANAAMSKLANRETVIYSIPVSEYDSRPHIPILVSPYDKRKEDQLINIRSFNNHRNILQYYLLIEKVKHWMSREKFESFSAAFMSFSSTFNYNDWAPHTNGKDGSLNPAIAFPATTVDILKEEIAKLSIKNASYEENKAQYVELGGMALEIHGYLLNEKLSKYYSRNIYEGGSNNHRLLISIDTENGAFEAIDSTGTHIGVYDYNGNLVKKYKEQKDITSHSLIGIRSSMFLC